MEQNHNRTEDVDVHCTITPAALALIDQYAIRRDLFRANWLREAISEKLEREIEAETGARRMKGKA